MICLKMCRMMDSVGILILAQLKTTGDSDLSWEELRLWDCDITRAEYSKLISYLQQGEGQRMAPEAEAEEVPESLHLISASRQPSHRQRGGVSERLPPCIVGGAGNNERTLELLRVQPSSPTYVWQADPKLPTKIVMDLSNHIPNSSVDSGVLICTLISTY